VRDKDKPLGEKLRAVCLGTVPEENQQQYHELLDRLAESYHPPPGAAEELEVARVAAHTERHNTGAGGTHPVLTIIGGLRSTTLAKESRDGD
jgi:hypothetical protein